MNKSRLAPFVLLMFAVRAPVTRAQTPSVLMISIDGMRPDYVTKADAHGLKVPTLRRLMAEGAYAEGVTGVFPTVTYPSHTTLVTGVWPAEHGIVNNQRFDPDHKLGGAWYWYADQIKVPTLWSAVHAAGFSTGSVGWPVTVDGNDIDFLIPEFWRANLAEPANPDDRFLMNALSRPVSELDHIQARVTKPYMEGNDTSLQGDEVKTIYSLDILRQHKPKFMTIHLSSLDEEEHLHGPFSAEANSDLEDLDGMVTRLAEQERTNDPNALIVVVSDHGFADIDRMVNLGVAFVDAGLMHPLATSATLGVPPASDWKAQPWGLGGMFAIMLHDPADTATRDSVNTLIEKLAADPANGIEAVLNPEQVAASGGVPEASFVVTLRKGYVPGANLTGSMVTSLPGHLGTHGYNPATTPEMRASFFIAGAGIAHGKDLGIIDMRSIAPTLADVLSVTLRDAKGTRLAIR